MGFARDRQIDAGLREIDALVVLVRTLAAEIDRLKEQIKELQERRGPGRPKKHGD